MPGSCIGYLFGVFDLLNVDHLDLLRQAVSRCDELVVGVVSDGLVRRSGIRAPIMPEDERLAIVAALRGVAKAALLDDPDVTAAARDVGAQVVFACSGGDVVPCALAPAGEAATSRLPIVKLTPARRAEGTAVRGVARAEGSEAAA